MKMLNSLLVAQTIVLAFACISRGDPQLFIENFDQPGINQRVLFSAAGVYAGIEDSEASGLVGGDANGNTILNGFVIRSWPLSNTGELPISNDQSGSGFFLFNQTLGGGGEYAAKFWGTLNPIQVQPSSAYSFSFFLTNQSPVNPAQVVPYVNGSPIGGPVSAVGSFETGNLWQQFSFAWNSGSSTSADLSLQNQRSLGGGNDFGIDTISFSGPAAVPEPSSLFSSLGLLALLAIRRQMSKRNHGSC